MPEAAASGAPHPIDAFVRAGLAKHGLSPSAPATPETLIRRVALGLTGLPPKPAEIEAFLVELAQEPRSLFEKQGSPEDSRQVPHPDLSPSDGERVAEGRVRGGVRSLFQSQPHQHSEP